MRLWVFSDLHLIFAGVATPLQVPAADVCVVAGDIHVRGADRSIGWLAEHVCPHMPVVFVAGNHEFYHTGFAESLASARDVAAGFENLHFLENDEVEINGVMFAGATLWTDFEVTGHRPCAMKYAEVAVSDYDEIRVTNRSGRRIRATHTLRMHGESRKFIEGFLTRHEQKPTVVVTHHAPSRQAISVRYANDITTAAFVSDLEPLIIERGPTMWVHGHVHQRQHYTLGKARILCNPRGYPGEPSFDAFDLSLVAVI